MVRKRKEKLLPAREAAKRLGISRWALYKWIKARIIKAVKLPSGRWGIPESEVERIIEGRKKYRSC